MDCTQCGTDTHVIEDRTSGDSVCTQCGYVLDSCMLFPDERSIGSDSQPILDTKHERVFRAVELLELESVHEWVFSIVNLLEKKTNQHNVTKSHIGGAILALYRQRSIDETNISDFICKRLECPQKRLYKLADEYYDLFRECDDNSDTDNLYNVMIERLSRVFDIDRKQRTLIHTKCVNLINTHPELQFKLPASLVIGVFFKFFFNADKKKVIKDTCAWMNVKPSTVCKMIRFLDLKS